LTAEEADHRPEPDLREIKKSPDELMKRVGDISPGYNRRHHVHFDFFSRARARVRLKKLSEA
jgi:hypothetical protein